MNYEVRCECGKPHIVTGTDAGASLPCGCGRTVEVPALHQLRLAAGQAGAAPELLLTNMLLKKELPDTSACVECGTITDGIVWAEVKCEEAEQRVERSTPTGCFLPGLLLGYIVISRTPQTVRELGREVRFRIPIRCCDFCARSLTTSSLRAALRQHPVCAGVLDKYPHAQVSRGR
jgi:hypothetical protein